MATADDAGAAFFGFLRRLGAEAEAKRDMSDAMGLSGSMLDELHAGFSALLVRAQDSGAVRTDLGLTELIALLKGLLVAVRAADSATGRDRVVAVLIDGLKAAR